MCTSYSPSSMFLAAVHDRYICYCTDIMRAVIRKRLLMICSNDEDRAYNILENYLHSIPYPSVPSYRNTLLRISNETFPSFVVRLDTNLSSRILLDTNGLGLLCTPAEHKAVWALRDERNRMVTETNLCSPQKRFEAWLRARTVLKEAAFTFFCCLDAATLLQIDQYYCGLEPLVPDAENSSLLAATARLPETERLAILLRYFNGLSQEQTAQILQLPREQVSCFERKGLIAIRRDIQSE